MKESIKEAFDAIPVNEERVYTTKRRVLAQMNQSSRKKRRYRRWMVAAVTVASLLLAASSAILYFTPTTVVSVDINPSLEMVINRFDRVVDVNAYNDDGVALVDALDMTHMSYSEAMDTILASNTVNDLMSRDGELTIAVVPTKSVEQSEEIVSYIDQCTALHENTHCYTMSAESHQQAHALGLSCGRYQAYEALSKVGANITPEQLNAMSMKEIRQQMAAYGIYDSKSGNGGCGQGNGNHQNRGQHRGHGRFVNPTE